MNQLNTYTLAQLRAETGDDSFQQLADGSIYWARNDLEFRTLNEAADAFDFVQWSKFTSEPCMV